MTRSLHACVNVRVSAAGALSRRCFLSCVGVGGAAFAGLSAYAGELKKQGRSCILLWMAGGPSQFETFDPKPGAATQGPTRAIATRVPGLQIAEHWPRTATVMNDLAVIRSMTSREGNHGRATYLLHTSTHPRAPPRKGGRFPDCTVAGPRAGRHAGQALPSFSYAC